MSALRADAVNGNPRLLHALGHAAFDYIELRWDKDGVRQFLMALRQRAQGGGADVFAAALGPSAEEFDEGFVAYLKEILARRAG
jgi:hypothetical protein